MALATLSVDLEARIAKFEAGMDRAGTLLERLSTRAGTAGSRIGEIFAGNFGASVAVETVQRLASFFPQVNAGVLAIKDLSEATGASIENISALDDIARRTGGSIGDVEGVLVKFNAALKEADGQNGTSRVLKAIGLDAAELRKQDPAEALRQVAVAFQGYADDGNKARAFQELFGKGVKEAATFMRELAEQQRLQGSVTDEQVEKVDRFNKHMAVFRSNIEDSARSISLTLLPALNRLFDRFNTQGIGGVLGQNEVDELTARSKALGNVSASIVQQLERWQPMAERGVGGAAEKVAELRGQLANVLRESTKVSDALKGIAPAPFTAFNDRRNGGGPNDKVGLPDVTGQAAKLKAAGTAFQDYSQTLTTGLAALIERTDTVKLAEVNMQLERLTELSAAGLDPKIVEQVQRMLSPPLGPNAGPQISDQMQRVIDLAGQTDSARLTTTLKDVQLLNDALSQSTPGTARWEQLQAALFDAQSAVTALSGTFVTVFDQFDQRTQQTADIIEGTLGGSFRALLEGNFKDIGKMWANLLIDMAAQAAAADLADKMFGTRGANGARKGDGWIDLALKWFSSASGSANGNAFGSAGMLAFADGGVVDRATPFTFGGGRLGVMGEDGPEAILPLKRGSDGKLGVSMAGRGGVVVNVHNTVNASAGVSRAELMFAMETTKGQTVAAVRDSIRRGNSGFGAG